MILNNDSVLSKVDNIYTLSDIHGDLEYLIVLLRDCAKVIYSKTDSWLNYANLTLPKNLNLYNIFDNYEYDFLFNFEWIGKNAIIIILGDIIDNYRFNYTVSDKLNHLKRQNEIEHEELKIILFINYLNREAQKKGGMVIKLIGNHEDLNFTSNILLNRYISPYALKTNFLNIKRFEIFKIYNNLFNHIIFKKNTVNKKLVIYKINNFIFLHGGLNLDIIRYFIDKLKNDFSINNLIDFINDEYNKCMINKSLICDKINTESGILWYRNLTINDKNNEEIICKQIDSIFKELLRLDQTEKELYLVVGHCVQSEYSMIKHNTLVSSHSNITKYDDIHIIDGIIQKTSHKNEIKKSDKNSIMIFGITTSCVINNANLAKLYRIDVGSSKAFDGNIVNQIFDNKIGSIIIKIYLKIKKLLEHKKYLNLQVLFNNNINIINKKYNINTINKLIELYKNDELDIHQVSKNITYIILINNKIFINKFNNFLIKFYISRIPQLLFIKYSDNEIETKIIRSSLHNLINHSHFFGRNNTEPFKTFKFITNIISKYYDL